MASCRTFAESDAKEDAMAAANKKLRHTTIVNTQYRTYHSCQQPKEWAYCQPPSLAEVKDLVKIMEAKGYEPVSGPHYDHAYNQERSKCTHQAISSHGGTTVLVSFDENGCYAVRSRSSRRTLPPLPSNPSSLLLKVVEDARDVDNEAVYMAGQDNGLALCPNCHRRLHHHEREGRAPRASVVARAPRASVAAMLVQHGHLRKVERPPIELVVTQQSHKARERLQNACEPMPLYYPANRSLADAHSI
ncbi:hypothetical protein NFJ02_20g43950 [Pycnococcus provasolii]